VGLSNTKIGMAWIFSLFFVRLLWTIHNTRKCTAVEFSLVLLETICIFVSEVFGSNAAHGVSMSAVTQWRTEGDLGGGSTLPPP
jgi:hypothetical protein